MPANSRWDLIRRLRVKEAFSVHLAITFLGASAKLRTATIGFVISVRQSVRPFIRLQKFGSHWKDIYEI